MEPSGIEAGAFGSTAVVREAVEQMKHRLTMTAVLPIHVLLDANAPKSLFQHPYPITA